MFSDPDFILVGQGVDSSSNNLDSFELIPWSKEAKSQQLVCTVPAGLNNGGVVYSAMGRMLILIAIGLFYSPLSTCIVNVF